MRDESFLFLSFILQLSSLILDLTLAKIGVKWNSIGLRF